MGLFWIPEVGGGVANGCDPLTGEGRVEALVTSLLSPSGKELSMNSFPKPLVVLQGGNLKLGTRVGPWQFDSFYICFSV